MKRPKKCPACNSTEVSKKEPFTCKKCKYVNDMNRFTGFRRYGGKQ